MRSQGIDNETYIERHIRPCWINFRGTPLLRNFRGNIDTVLLSRIRKTVPRWYHSPRVFDLGRRQWRAPRGRFSRKFPSFGIATGNAECARNNSRTDFVSNIFYYTYINENIYMVDCSFSKQRSVNIISYSIRTRICFILFLLFFSFSSFSRRRPLDSRGCRGTCRPTRVDHGCCCCCVVREKRFLEFSFIS